MTDVIDTKYDVIVIGSGIGGLICANSLAAAGARTLLAEHHYEVGGRLQGGWRQGFYGTQSMEIKGAILPRLKLLQLDDQVKFRQDLGI